MAQMQKVSWRTVGYAALGTTAIIAAAIGIVHSDGVRPTSLKSSAATRWLVYQPEQLLVLADGLSGRVLAKIDATSDASGEIAVQGAGGAFLVAPSLGSVRPISTAKLQLGTPQVVASLSATINSSHLGVGANGLTVVNTDTDVANIVPVADVTRPITIPKSNEALVARDGSMWLFTKTEATHVNVDETSRTLPIRGSRDATTTVGSHALFVDHAAQMVHWLEGGDVSVSSIPNAADAVLQTKADEASCVWMGADDTLACVGRTAIDRTVHVAGLNLGPSDKLAVAGSIAVIVRAGTNQIQRVELDSGRLLTTGNPTDVPVEAQLTITAVNGMVWIDDQRGALAWVIQQFGVRTIEKNDQSAPLLDAQGQVKDQGLGGSGATGGAGNVPGDDAETDHLDHNGHDDPPVAVPDSVTARAGDTVTIPVTGNDYDPDGDALAVLSVGDREKAGHGTTDVLDGSSIAYVPELGFSGSDEFEYTIVDEHGNHATSTVKVELFAPDSPNRPPIATPDHVKTRLGRPVTIDVLANDIDPERDTLTVPTFGQNGSAKITDTKGPTGLPALRYDPPATPGVYTFTYQAADPQGGTSDKTLVTVDVLGNDSPNQPPKANPDAIRLRAGTTRRLDVRANDVDPDGDDLTIAFKSADPGVDVSITGQQLEITLQPGATDSSLILYTLSDGTPGHDQLGHVLVLRIGDTAPNRPPVANPDSERVVVGNSVSVPVTANDVDPEHDAIRLLTADQPEKGVGTTTVEDNAVLFTPHLPDISQPTPVSFTYKIGDGHGNVAFGTVTVTVLVEALPRAPFARDDFADTFTDKPVNIDVLANDSDPSGGQPNIVGEPTCTNGGSATTTADERVTFVPPAGQNGPFRCKYRVRNRQQLEAEAWIIVTVTEAPPGNHDPTLSLDQLNQSVPVGGSITLHAGDLAKDIDGDSLTFTSVSKPDVGSSSFTQKAESFVYTAPLIGSADATPADANLDVTISDGKDGNVRGTISIKIIPAPPTQTTLPAPIPVDIHREGTVGEPLSVDVLAELKAANDGAALTLRSATLTDGDATWTVTGGTVGITPMAAGTVAFTYVVANSDQQQSSGTITVTASEPPVVNPPPVAVGDSLVVPSGGTNSVEILANDSGISDSGDKVKVVLVTRPPSSFGTIDPTDLSNGILTLTATPGADGSVRITYDVSDGTGNSDTAFVDITILPCSESPPLALSATVFTPYQTPLNIDLGQYAISGRIRPGSVNGAGLTGPTGTYTPPAGESGSVSVTFIVENGCHQSDTGLLTIDVNRAPVANAIRRDLAQGDTLTLLATDIASDDERLTIASIDSNPAWVTLVPGADGPTIRATPPADASSGGYTFTATVEDPGGLSAVATIILAISNLPPTAVADEYTTDGSQYLFDPTVNDSDSEPGPLTLLTVAAIYGPGTVLSTTGNWISVSLGHGVSRFSYTIVDSGGLTASSTITITSNSPPTMPDVTAATLDQPTLNVDVSPSDPDGDLFFVACESTPDVQVVVEIDPGTPPQPDRVRLELTVINQPTPEAPISFQCTVTDRLGAKAVSTVTLTLA